MFYYKDKKNQEVFQWDKNIIIVFTEGQPGDEIHFSNDNKKALVTKLNEKLETKIPNSLLMEDKRILVYHYLQNSKGAEYTSKRKIIIPIKREKPEDYIASDDEVITIKDIVNESLNIASQYQNLSIQSDNQNKYISWIKSNKISLIENNTNQLIFKAKNKKFTIFSAHNTDYQIAFNIVKDVEAVAFYNISNVTSGMAVTEWQLCSYNEDEDSLIIYKELEEIPENKKIIIANIDNTNWYFLSSRTKSENEATYLRVGVISRDGLLTDLKTAIKEIYAGEAKYFNSDEQCSIEELSWNFSNGSTFFKDKYANKWVENLGKLGEGESSLIFNSADSSLGANSIAAGLGTTAKFDNQIVLGKYNKNDNGKPLIIGYGTDDGFRTNIFTINDQGKISLGRDDNSSYGDVLVYSKKLKKSISLIELYETVNSIWYGDKEETIFSKYPVSFNPIVDTITQNYIIDYQHPYPFTRKGLYTFKIKNLKNQIQINDLSIYSQNRDWSIQLLPDSTNNNLLNLTINYIASKQTIFFSSTSFSQAGSYYFGISVEYPQQIPSKYLDLPVYNGEIE